LFKKSNDIDLAIVFRSSNSTDKAKLIDNVMYYPVHISAGGNKLVRVLNKALLKLSWYDELDNYSRIIEEFKPDVIHVFGTEENFGFITSITKIPVVLSIQGNMTVYSWKYFSGVSKFELFSSFNFKNFIRFSTAFYKYMLFKKLASREQAILKDIKHIIGRTDWDRRIAKVLSPKAKYYYNDEILRESFYQESIVENELKDKLVITTMSGPAPYKGLETVCMAVTILNELKIDFKWNVGGIDESNNLISSIKKKLGKNYPDENIFFLDKLGEEQIINLLRKTNIYVLPSHIENSPLTLSEAMVMGLPIVATLAGGTGSRMTDKEEGLLIQSGDPWSMVGAILELIENFELAIEYGKNARSRALKRHDPKKVVNDLVSIYMDIKNFN